jgi:hypothetical protein
MNKKNNLALFTLILIGLFNILPSNVFAQVTNFIETKSEKEKTCSSVPFEMPAAIAGNPEAFTIFMRVMSLPSGARQQAFSELSNEDKATLYKVNLALQFIKRPNLNNEQKALLLDTIAVTNADIYDKTNPAKVAQTERHSKTLENNGLRLFPRNEFVEIFAGMNGDKSFEISLLTRYEDLLKFDMMSRKQIAKELPLVERYNLWNTQLIFHLTTSSLNKQQKEFILEIMPKIPLIFEASRTLIGIEREKYLEALESSMFRVFGKESAYAIFMEIGIQKLVRNSSLKNQLNSFTIFTKIATKSNRWDKINFEFLSPQAYCNCRWWCTTGDCEGTGCIKQNKCGPFDDWECTNKCVRTGEEEIQ